MVNSTRRASGALLWLMLGLLALGFGCASAGPGPAGYDYFARPDPSDPWIRKIQRWQQRESTQKGEDALGSPADVAEPGLPGAAERGAAQSLQTKYRAFRATQKRHLAQEVASWIQSQSREHYIPDGPIDRWATLAETLHQNGDDCDGLELLAFNLLRDLGFPADEVFRAIVYRRSDGQHHMVTFWFEDHRDPWVIDPTGAMTSGMPRMSEVPGWVPLKVFNEDRNFDVERMRFLAAN